MLGYSSTDSTVDIIRRCGNSVSLAKRLYQAGIFFSSHPLRHSSSLYVRCELTRLPPYNCDAISRCAFGQIEFFYFFFVLAIRGAASVCPRYAIISTSCNGRFVPPVMLGTPKTTRCRSRSETHRGFGPNCRGTREIR